MKKTLTFLALGLLTLAAASCTGGGRGNERLIRTAIPERPAGQTDVLQLTVDPIADVGIGVVGLGMRGSDAVQRLSFVPGCHVAAVCDIQYRMLGGTLIAS